MTTHRSARRRPGVTLAEVLVALFVMALGMVALLTLFPLGAMQVGQALKDDRCAQLAAQADAYFRQQWRVSVVQAMNQVPPATPYPIDDFVAALDDPNLLARGPLVASASKTQPVYSDIYVNYKAFAGVGTGYLLPSSGTLTLGTSGPSSTGGYVIGGVTTSLVTTADAASSTTPSPNPAESTTNPFRYVNLNARTPNVPGYPVLIDPLGWNTRAGDMGQYWVAAYQSSEQSTIAAGTVRIPRRTIGLNSLRSSVSSPALQTYPPSNAPDKLFNPTTAFDVCALADDVTYTSNGGAVTTLNRQGRYTCAAVIQRPRNEDVTTANLTILVFDGRLPLYAVPGDEAVVSPDFVIPNTSRQITLSLPPRTPDQSFLLRRGGWIMDGTIAVPNASLPLSVQTTGVRNANFYRIVGITENPPNGGNTQYTLDIDPPFANPAGLSNTQTQLYLFAGLAEVFTRPALQPDTLTSP